MRIVTAGMKIAKIYHTGLQRNLKKPLSNHFKLPVKAAVINPAIDALEAARSPNRALPVSISGTTKPNPIKRVIMKNTVTECLLIIESCPISLMIITLYFCSVRRIGEL
jgi:hypothetical protein